MTELKQIIDQLDDTIFHTIEEDFRKTKADNFLFLLKAYKENRMTDASIIKHLNVTKNSFYVLKSRLHDKIKLYLTRHLNLDKEETLRQLQEITEICYTMPRVVANSMLLKLEKDLLYFDMHYELQKVYAALKKNHLYSDRYFHYSQLYNKQVALGFSLEKSEELLGEFCTILSLYHFSKSDDLLEKLFFLRKEVINHSHLNASKQVLLIKQLMELQILIFCDTTLNRELSVVELLKNCSDIIEALPNSSAYKRWRIVLEYLYFEYYHRTEQLKLAGMYYDKVNANMSRLLLYNGICCCNRFFITKIAYLQAIGEPDRLIADKSIPIHCDNENLFTEITLGIYHAMISYHELHIKDAIAQLRELLNSHTFKDYFHVYAEIKLTFVFFNIQAGMTREIEPILLNLKRKIKSDKLGHQYSNLLLLIKLFLLELKEPNAKRRIAENNLLALFTSENTGKHHILPFLMNELVKKYKLHH